MSGYFFTSSQDERFWRLDLYWGDENSTLMTTPLKVNRNQLTQAALGHGEQRYARLGRTGHGR